MGHVQEKAPFTIGCFGPDFDTDGKMKLVSLATCRKLYSTVKAQDGSVACGSGTQKVTTKAGTETYDNWCPCYDATGSSIGTKELPVFDDAAAVTCKDSNCDNTAATTSSPASSAPQSASFGLLSLAVVGAIASLHA